MRSKTDTVFLILIFCLIMPCVSAAGVSIPSGLTYTKEIQPGSMYDGTIQLMNTGNESQEVRIYQTDYLFYSDGKSIYGEPGEDPRSNADWITFSPHRLIIPPKSTAQVNYTVSVPDNENLAGTYWSMLMAEEVAQAAPEIKKDENALVSVGIRQTMRYGIQLITNIADTGTRKLKFAMTKVLKADNKRILQVDMENIGERWLRPSLWAELYNEKGISIGKFEGNKLRIYPGTSARFKIDLSSVPGGTYQVLVVADCDDDDLFGASYTLQFK